MVFNCREMVDPVEAERRGEKPLPEPPALEIGTRVNPIPPNATATIRLTYFEGMDTNSLPALINCGGRMDINGAPMNRTWVKLGGTAKPGDSKVTLTEAVTGWRVGDKVIVTINRGHDDESVQYGSFTYEDLRLENCRIGRDPLIQLACTSPHAGAAGHFRGLTITNSASRYGKVVDLGGRPRNDKLQNPVAYYFHDYPSAGRVTKVVSAKFTEEMSTNDYRPVEGFTGKDVRAAEVKRTDQQGSSCRECIPCRLADDDRPAASNPSRFCGQLLS